MNSRLLFVILLAQCPSLFASAAAAAGAGAGQAPVASSKKGLEEAMTAARAAQRVALIKNAHIFPTQTTNPDGDSGHVISFSPDGKWLAVTNRMSRTISIFSIDATTGKLKPTLESPFPVGRVPVSVSFSPNGKFLAIGILNEGVAIFSFNESTQTFKFAFKEDQSTWLYSQINGATFSPNGKFLAVSAGSLLYISSVDQETGALTILHSLQAGHHSDRVSFSPNGQWLVRTKRHDNNNYGIALFPFDQNTGSLTPILQENPFHTDSRITNISFSPDSCFMAISYYPDEINVFSIDQQTGILQLMKAITPPGSSPKAQFAPNGTLLAIAHQEDYAVSTYFVNQETGTLTMALGSQRFREKNDQPASISFSLNGQLLAIAGEDDKISIYEVDESNGTVSPITGDTLIHIIRRKQEHALMHDVLLKAHTELGQTKPAILPGGPISQALEEYIVGPKPVEAKPISQATQKEEAQALDPATALTQKQRKEKDSDATHLFVAIKKGNLKKVKKHLTPFTVNAHDQDYKTPLIAAAFYNQTDVASYVLGYTGIQEEYGKKITVRSDVNAQDKLKNTALSYATAHGNQNLIQALVVAIENEKKIQKDAKKD